MKKLLIYFAFCMTVQLFAQNSFKVEIQGKGQPILLLPGFSCKDAVFTDLKKELTRNYEVHSFTYAGFGEVSPIEFPWLPQIKTDLQRYIQSKNLENPILIGHSMGGTLGLWLASENTAISQLVLIDALPATGALMIPNYDSQTIQYETPYNEQMLKMDDPSFLSMAQQMASNMTHHQEKQKELVQWMVNADRKTYVYGYTDLLKLDLREQLHKIDIPVTILAATDPYGKEMVKSTYKEQFKNLNHYEIKFAENAKHFIMYDQPEWFLEQIKNTLKSRNEEK